MNTQSLALTLVTILATIIPTSLLLWLISCSGGGAGSSDPSFAPGSEMQSPVRWFLAIFLPVYVVMKALSKKSLDLSGGLVALVIGFVLTLSSYAFTAALLVFFYSSNRLTRFRASEKRRIDESYRESGQRNWTQVICNGGIACQMSLMYLF